MKYDNNIKLQLGDFYLSAGILGFYKILCEDENLKNKIIIENDFFTIDTNSILNADLTDLYFKALIKKYNLLLCLL